MTIYRGYDIKPTEDGKFGIHSTGSFAVITETFNSEDAAMDFIDKTRRAAIQGN